MPPRAHLLAAPISAAAASLALLGTLAGCSAAGDAAGQNAAGPADTSAEYTDGQYSASGAYQSPNGTETIEVQLTLVNDAVTEVTVTPGGSNPTTQFYQGEFVSGIAAEVVGKDVDELQVTRVAGSSLTSGGFREAVDAIKADALVG